MAVGRVFGWSEQGGATLTVAGVGTIAQTVQRSFPGATVTVLNHGTATLSTIYADDALTPKPNPFTSDSTTGYWFFYAVPARFDIGFSGAGIVTPFTLDDVFLCCETT